MCGISGSGKTYYARRLEKAGYTRLSSDALIWEKVGEDPAGLPKAEKRQLFAECRRQMLHRLVELLKEGKKVVVDATFCHRDARDEIRELCGALGVEPDFVYCHADKEELWRRLSQRKGADPDDLKVSKEELAEYWHGFEHPREDETDFLNPF